MQLTHKSIQMLIRNIFGSVYVDHDSIKVGLLSLQLPSILQYKIYNI